MRKMVWFLPLLVHALVGIARADSLNVRLIGRCDMPGEAAGVAVSGDYVCVANSGAFRVVSVANPANPVEVGHNDSPWAARGVDVGGDYAYVADGDSSLRVFSIADPANPVEVGRCRTPYMAGSVVVSGEYAYVGDDRGLRVISVADPMHPTEVGHGGTYRPYCLAVRGSYLYVADVSQGVMRIIDIADPTNPTEVGYYYAARGIQAVAVDDRYAYVAASDSTFRVISVDDPSQPVDVGCCRFTVDYGYPAAPQDVEVVRGYAFVTTFYSGLRVISVVDPAHPGEVGHYGGWGWSLDTDTSYVYCGDNSGMMILEFYGGGVEEGRTQQVTSRRPATTVVRNLPTGALAYDPMGRRVAIARPGVYFVRTAQAQAQAQAIRKVVVTR